MSDAETGSGGPLQVVADRLFNDWVGDHFGHLTGRQFLVLTLGLLGILFFPYWAQNVFPVTYIHTAALACVWAIFAMSWDFQSGFTGYISFGHSVLSGSAAYAAAMLLTHVDPEMNFHVVAIVAIVVALVVGLLVALPSLRLEGPYFSLITFVAVLLLTRLIGAFGEWTNGELGLRINRNIQWAPGATEPFARYYLMLFPMLLVGIVLVYLARSNTGLILTAIRENEPAVSAAGLNPTKFKLWSFVVSSIPMGLGGVLLLVFYGSVDPSTFVIVDNSIEMIAMAVIGGMASILGPLFGAFLFVFLADQLLEGLLEWAPLFHEGQQWVVLWIVVLFILVFARNGIFRWLWSVLGGDAE